MKCTCDTPHGSESRRCDYCRKVDGLAQALAKKAKKRRPKSNHPKFDRLEKRRDALFKEYLRKEKALQKLKDRIQDLEDRMNSEAAWVSKDWTRHFPHSCNFSGYED